VSYRVYDAASDRGRRKPVRQALGIASFGANQFDLRPGQEGSRHDETASGQEELYVALRGSGELRVGADAVSLRPGVYVAVPPELERQVAAGPDGLSYLVIGSAPTGYVLEEGF
jgi:quercetin dioxygenase-like cupin family protein